MIPQTAAVRWLKVHLHNHKAAQRKSNRRNPNNAIEEYGTPWPSSASLVPPHQPVQLWHPQLKGEGPCSPDRGYCLQGHGIHYGIQGKRILRQHKTYYEMLRGRWKARKRAIWVVWGGPTNDKYREKKKGWLLETDCWSRCLSGHALHWPLPSVLSSP